MVHLGHSFMSPPPRAEPVGTREAIRPQDRLQHQLQGHLDYPAGDGRDAQTTLLAIRLGNHPLPHRQRAETAVLQRRPQPLQEPLDTRGLDVPGRTAIHPGRTGALITPHANPRHQKERGIADKVVQIIKPAMRIITSPSVQLGLDPQYPALRLVKGVLQLRIAGIHQRNSRHSILLPAGLLAPLALRLSRPPRRVATPATTTGPPPRPRPSADDEPARCRAGDPEGRAATSGYRGRDRP